jgi:hypothetical protein
MMACFRHGLYWRGLKHDLSKLNLTKEFIPYARFFYSDNKPKRDKTGYYKPYDTGNEPFEKAWVHHLHNNSHHYEHWLNPRKPEDGSVPLTLRMPEKDMLEMICDWEGAGKAQHSTTNQRQWYEINKHHLMLHPESQEFIENKLKEWYPEEEK